ncbi:ribosome-binding protein aMBF1 (putative translation factor) [Parabacteroides sp. PFB2-10]|uniref:helix-turn-helix domain-containing protein n=1 Tax=Parabacteroides sp. PFB2-10 TaxID=1742405 RepID=UPI002474A7D2|nr:helix-turn-helix transcriptional regulator [Parabacteroides sp. PFB2-10]MDH6313425.1 ribosome-binding protein aMBF1 (putative translation factor) [Parabacteroides sp. PFB2-10]
MQTNKKKISLKEIVENIPERDVKRVAKRIQIVNMIVEGMDQKGLGKKDLARLMHKTPSTITRWLSGDHNFETETLFDIEDALGINIINKSSDTLQKDVAPPIIITSVNPTYRVKNLNKFEPRSNSIRLNFNN